MQSKCIPWYLMTLDSYINVPSSISINSSIMYVGHALWCTCWMGQLPLFGILLTILGASTETWNFFRSVVDIYQLWIFTRLMHTFLAKMGPCPPLSTKGGGISNLGGATIFCTFVYIKFCENCTFWL